MILGTLASATMMVGIAIIYSSWRRSISQRLLANLVGWLLVSLSAVFWVIASGLAFGAVYFVVTLPLIAWLCTAFQVSFQTDNPKLFGNRELSLFTWRNAARHFGVFVLALPISGLSSALISLGLTSLVPWQEIDRLALLTLLMPTLWGLLMFWCCADQKIMRPAVAIISTGLTAGLVQLG